MKTSQLGEKKDNWSLFVKSKHILTGTNKEVYNKAVEMGLGPRPNKLNHDDGTVVVYRGGNTKIHYVDLYDVLKKSDIPKYNMEDLVEGRDREDNVVVTGEVIEIHTFDDRPTIYAIKELGTDDRYIFGEDKLSTAHLT